MIHTLHDVPAHDVGAVTVALYATDAHKRATLTDREFNQLVAQGTRTLGADHVAALARRLHGITAAWARGHLTTDDYTALRNRLLPDGDRFERCYGHAIGEPYP